MAKRNKIKLPSTISETIYQYLKKEIIEGRLKPKQRIIEREISKLFNVSSTPVREALYRLTAEKYLVFNARKEVFVQETTLTEVKELYEIVRILDKLALEKFFENLRDKDINELKAMTVKLGEYYKKNKINLYLKQNLRIHQKIWEKSKRKYLQETLAQIMEKISIFRKYVSPFSEPLSIEKSYKDHLKLMKAIENRDIDSIQKIISSHWGEEFYIYEKKQ